MGTNPSKHEDYYIHSQDKKSYQNVVRAYAKWDYNSGLTTHDESRFSVNEMKNFKKHKQISQKYLNQQTNIPIQTDPSIRKKTHLNENISRSQSIDDDLCSTNLITAEQLINKQTQRHKSFNEINQNLSNTNNSNQFISLNNKIKQIPLNLQLVLIDQNDLQNVNEIGKGNFGTVYRASYKGNRDVALKTLKSPRGNNEHGVKCSIEEYDNNMYELLHEAHIMRCLEHPNLLRIIGVTFFGKEKQLSLVTDFMKNGSLLDYLRKHKEIFVKSDSKDITIKLNSFSKQIFQAMLYLEERSIIHRDLAARNCLIGEQNILKVADFGLTRLTDCGLYKGTYRTICAIRWTSPEGIFSSKYTSRSDVWSYGITLWEIYSLGKRPFGYINNTNVKNILKNSSENLSHYLPKSNQFGCDEIYTHIILPCLTYNAALRPRFRDLIERIRTIFDDHL